MGTIPTAWADHRNAHPGPFEYNGNLYALGNGVSRMALFKSTDSGDTWTNVAEATNGIALNANGGASGVLVGSTLYAMGWDSNLVAVGQFDLSTDTYTGTATQLLTVSLNISNTYPAFLSVRSNGDIIVFHNTATEMVMGTDYRRFAYSIYSGGTWTTAVPSLQSGVQDNFDARGAVLGASDTVHMFYTRTTLNDDIFHLPLLSSNSLGTGTTSGATLVGNASYTSIPVFDGTSEVKLYVRNFIKRMDSSTGNMVDDSNGPQNLEASTSNPVALVIGSDGIWHALIVPSTTDDVDYINDQGTDTWTTPTAFATSTTQGISANQVAENLIGVLYNDNGTVTYSNYTLFEFVNGDAALNGTGTLSVSGSTTSMSTSLSNNFDAYSSGDLTHLNSADSGDKFDIVQSGDLCSIEYTTDSVSTTTGNAIVINSVVDELPESVGWNTPDRAEWYARFYFKLPTAPGVAVGVAQTLNAFDYSLSLSDSLQLFWLIQGSSAVVLDPFPTNRWVRFETYYSQPTNEAFIRIFNVTGTDDPHSTIPDVEYTHTGQGNLGLADGFYLSTRPTNTIVHPGNIQTLFDDVAYSTSGWIGPSESTSGQESGSAVLSGSSTVSTNSSITSFGLTAVTGSSDVVAAAFVESTGSSSFAANGTMSTSGAIEITASSTLSSFATTSISGSATTFAVGAWNGSASLSSGGLGLSTGSATTSAIATSTTTGIVVAFGVSAVSTTANLTISALRETSGTAVLSGQGSLTTQGIRGVFGDATLNTAATVTTTSYTEQQATATLLADAASNVTAFATTSGTASIASVGSQLIVGFAQKFATSTLSASATTDATGEVSTDVSVTLDSTASLSVVDTVSTTGQSSMTADALVASESLVTAFGISTTTATGTITASGVGQSGATSTLSSTAGMSTVPSVQSFGVIANTADAQLAANGTQFVTATVPLTADATMTVVTAGQAVGDASLSATATSTSIGSVESNGDTAMLATATTTADGFVTSVGSSTITASGDLSATATLEQFGTVNIASIGTKLVVGFAEKFAQSTLDATAILSAVSEGEIGGSASLSATVSLQTVATASTAGSSTLTAMSTMSTNSIVEVDGTVTADASASMSVTGQTQSVNAIVMSASADMSSDAQLEQFTSASISATGHVDNVVGTATSLGAATMSTTAVQSVVGTLAQNGMVSMSGSASADSAGTRSVLSTADMTGVSIFTSTGVGNTFVQISVVGNADLSTAIQGIVFGNAVLQALAVLTASGGFPSVVRSGNGTNPDIRSGGRSSVRQYGLTRARQGIRSGVRPSN